jgi:hypothetical protein
VGRRMGKKLEDRDPNAEREGNVKLHGRSGIIRKNHEIAMNQNLSQASKKDSIVLMRRLG